VIVAPSPTARAGARREHRIFGRSRVTQTEHKGFGTLLSLREAMSLSPGFVDIVEDTLPQMSSLDLDVLRMEALPILTGWAYASPLGDGHFQVRHALSGCYFS
jgi:hypothetical protein